MAGSRKHHRDTLPVQVWSSYLVYHLMSVSVDEGVAGFNSLLQLLLSLTTKNQDDVDVRSAAAAAVRALSCSAMSLGWEKLHLGTPALLQVCLITWDSSWGPAACYRLVKQATSLVKPLTLLGDVMSLSLGGLQASWAPFTASLSSIFHCCLACICHVKVVEVLPVWLHSTSQAC